MEVIKKKRDYAASRARTVKSSLRDTSEEYQTHRPELPAELEKRRRPKGEKTVNRKGIKERGRAFVCYRLLKRIGNIIPRSASLTLGHNCRAKAQKRGHDAQRALTRETERSDLRRKTRSGGTNRVQKSTVSNREEGTNNSDVLDWAHQGVP